VWKAARPRNRLAHTPNGFHSTFNGLVLTDEAVYYGVSKAAGLLDVRRIRKPS
jgi:hypothetical protein